MTELVLYEITNDDKSMHKLTVENHENNITIVEINNKIEDGVQKNYSKYVNIKLDDISTIKYTSVTEDSPGKINISLIVIAIILLIISIILFTQQISIGGFVLLILAIILFIIGIIPKGANVEKSGKLSILNLEQNIIYERKISISNEVITELINFIKNNSTK